MGAPPKGVDGKQIKRTAVPLVEKTELITGDSPHVRTIERTRNNVVDL